MIIRVIFFISFFFTTTGICQTPHLNAHAHNDYEHTHPLVDALLNRFNSVEADVHLKKNKLVVAHNFASTQSPELEQLYLVPLDSMIRANHGCVYPCQGTHHPFYLMIDVKTDAEATYLAISEVLSKYPSLNDKEAIRIFLSGNRAIKLMANYKSVAVGIDGRPDDLQNGYSPELMPVISDNFKNWSHWNGKSKPNETDLREIKSLANRVHAENKRLRLWAIPDNEFSWEALMDAGVDLISTDHLEDLNRFLNKKGL